MFPVSGPTPIAPVQSPNQGDLFLRVNQRVAGEVIQVSNEQVVLSIQGVQVVAKLTTPEQAVMLQDKRFASFIVRDMANEVIVLQLADPGAEPQSSPAAASRQESTLVSALLKQLGLNTDNTNMLLAQAALRAGLPITKEVLEELRQSLNKIPGWSSQEADQAALLKFAGLPITEGTLALLSKSPVDVSDSIASLIKGLGELGQNPALPEALRMEIQQAIRVLSQGILDGSASSDQLALHLQKAVSLLGKTLEQELIKFPQTGASELERGLLALSHLKTELASRGFQSIAGEIDRFNDYLRLIHLFNSGPNNESIHNQWLRMDIPVQYPPLPGLKEEELHPAQIHIAREKDQQGEASVNPAYTRIVIQMEVIHGQTMEVDLSVVGKQLGLSITTNDKLLTQAAHAEILSLQDGLGALGYETRFTQVDTGEIHGVNDADQRMNTNLASSSINLEA